MAKQLLITSAALLLLEDSVTPMSSIQQKAGQEESGLIKNFMSNFIGSTKGLTPSAWVSVMVASLWRSSDGFHGKVLLISLNRDLSRINQGGSNRDSQQYISCQTLPLC